MTPMCALQAESLQLDNMSEPYGLLATMWNMFDAVKSYCNAPFHVLWVYSLYKSAPLLGMPQSALYPQMRPWDVFLREWHATTCPMGEDRQNLVSIWDKLLNITLRS